MRISNSFDISSSALTSQRLRMDVIASNIANAETTRGRLVNGKWIPYQRKLVVMEPKGNVSFGDMLRGQMEASTGNGVRVTKIYNDPEPFKQVYDPSHPDADKSGFVLMPNVDVAKEMVDMLTATRSYEANVTALNATKAMIAKALEIGR